MWYEVKVYYGGTLDKPNIECDCIRFSYKKWCSHCERTWEGMGGFAQSNAVHHDEIANKSWYKKKP